MIIQSMTMTQNDQASIVTTVSGIAKLSQLGIIRVEGADAATFLQGQLTQDLVGLGMDGARLAAFCNAKGRMQASFVVFKRLDIQGNTEFLMVCSAAILAQTLKRLSMFVMRAKVRLIDATDEFLLYGLAGNAIYSGAVSSILAWSRHDFEGKTTVMLYPGAGTQRALWCAPVGTPLPVAQALLPDVWDWLEVQSGIAMVTQGVFEALVPQMLNYESVGGVNFKKGCYPGQEVVARSQFRGTLKRRAFIVHGLGEPHVGQEIFHSADAEQPSGLVAAKAANPAGGFDAIVSIQTSAATSGTLTLGAPQGAALSLLPLPYPLKDDI